MQVYLMNDKSLPFFFQHGVMPAKSRKYRINKGKIEYYYPPGLAKIMNKLNDDDRTINCNHQWEGLQRRSIPAGRSGADKGQPCSWTSEDGRSTGGYCR